MKLNQCTIWFFFAQASVLRLPMLFVNRLFIVSEKIRNNKPPIMFIKDDDKYYELHFHTYSSKLFLQVMWEEGLYGDPLEMFLDSLYSMPDTAKHCVFLDEKYRAQVERYLRKHSLKDAHLHETKLYNVPYCMNTGEGVPEPIISRPCTLRTMPIRN